MPTYTGLSVFSDLLLVRGAFWGNGLAASCTLQTPLPGGRSCIIRTGAEPYSLKCRIPSRRILLENRASGKRGSRKLISDTAHSRKPDFRQTEFWETQR